MTNEDRQKLEQLCGDLRRRATLNRPFDAEQLIGTLLLLAESVLALAPPTEAQPPPANTPPNVPKTVTRHE